MKRNSVPNDRPPVRRIINIELPEGRLGLRLITVGENPKAAETAGLVHGTNERISQRSYIQGLRVLIRIMESSCGFAAS